MLVQETKKMKGESFKKWGSKHGRNLQKLSIVQRVKMTPPLKWVQ